MKKKFDRGYLTLLAESSDEVALVKKINETSYSGIDPSKMPLQIGEFFKIFRYCGTVFGEKEDEISGLVFQLEPRVMPLQIVLVRSDGRYSDLILAGNENNTPGRTCQSAIIGHFRISRKDCIEDAMKDAYKAASIANRLPFLSEFFAVKYFRRIEGKYS